MKKTRVSMAVMGVAFLGGASGAQAATIEAGDWKLSFGGNINAFYSLTSCDAGDLNSGAVTYAGLACAGATDENGEVTDYSTVTNGLLPASMNFTASTVQNGWDVAGTINVYYGISSAGTNGSNAAGADALKFSTVDARQVFMTFGREGAGSFKFGRDFGIFGFDAIINDMTLLGQGAMLAAAEPGHTTFGGLGFGYVYVDRLAQMNYTTPSFGGFTATLGIFQGLDANGGTNGDKPGFHGKASYSMEGDVGATVSASFISQNVNTDAGTSEDIKGFDLFGKVSFVGLGLVGYYYDGEGMTPLALGGLILPGFGANGTPEESSGGYLQATYQLGKAKLGINWSKNEAKTVTPHENQKLGLGVYYALTPALNLVGELSWQESELDAVLGGGKDESQNLSLGAILFF